MKDIIKRIIASTVARALIEALKELWEEITK